MPLREEDIHINGRHLSISRWDHHNKKGEIIFELTLRLYNAVSYSHKKENPVWQRTFSYEEVRTMIDFEREINISHLLNQPLVLTYEENQEKEIRLNIPIGKPYEILILYDEYPVGPTPAKVSWRKKRLLKGSVSSDQKTELVMEIQIPSMPSIAQLPPDLLGYQLDFSNGKKFYFHLPDLCEGKNKICYYNPVINSENSVHKGKLEIRNDLKNYFKIVYRQ